VRHALWQYLQVRGAGQGALSPDGRRLLFVAATTGTPQLWRLDSPLGWPEQVTFFQERVQTGRWTPDGARILFETDVGGTERMQLYSVAPDGSDLRRLTFEDAAIHRPSDFHPDGVRVAFATNVRNGRDFDLYLLDTVTGAQTKLCEREGSTHPVGFTPDGKKLLFVHARANVDQDLLLCDVESGAVELLTPHEGDVRYETGGFTPDGRFLHVSTDLGREFRNRARLDLSTKMLDGFVDEDADTEALELSKDGRYLAWIANRDGYGELHVQEVETGRDVAVTGLEPGVTQSLSFARDVACLAVTHTSSHSPGTVHRLGLEHGHTPERWTTPTLAGLDPTSFVAPALVTYPTFDGREIPAFLYVPRGAAQDGTLSVIVDVHGGPESQERPDWNAVIQYLVGRGFGVLAPNIRGSSGYGRTYVRLDDVARRLDSIQDVALAAEYLATSRWADAKRIAVMGGSYGGYAALSSLAFHPERWAAGISIVGISNLLTFLRNTGAYRRALRIAEYGDPVRDEELLRRISPFYAVDQIRAPLLIIHGANDPRVPLSEAEQMVDALRARGGEVESLIFHDEGHGIVKLTNKLRCWEKVAEFFDRYLAR
jgi:dipeptidyl aminopeptidase/acylaminoacyl peptidase